MDGISKRQAVILFTSLAMVVLLSTIPLFWLTQKYSNSNDNAVTLLEAYAASWKGDSAYDLLAAEAVQKGLKKEDPSGGWVLGVKSNDGSCWVVVVNSDRSVEGPLRGSSQNCLR